MVDAVHHLGQCLGRLMGRPRALLNRFQGALDQCRRILGGGRGLVGQAADLICHHGETLASRSRPGCLHCGVQRKNVGLQGNVLDAPDDFPNFTGALADIPHRGQHLVHALSAGIRARFYTLCFLACRLRALGVPVHLAGNLVDGSGELLDGGRLLGGSLRHGLGSHGYLFGTGRHLVGGLVDLKHRSAQALVDLPHGQQNLLKLPHIALSPAGVHCKIPLGHLSQHMGFIRDHIRQRGRHAAHIPGQTPQLIL